MRSPKESLIDRNVSSETKSRQHGGYLVGGTVGLGSWGWVEWGMGTMVGRLAHNPLNYSYFSSFSFSTSDCFDCIQVPNSVL